MYDPELNQNFYQENNFEKSIDLEIRLGFIRKVFGLLCCQLGLTTLMVLVAMNSLGF
jgi:hypothetical protein